MTQYVVTIARQFGSLGRTIGKKLAEELSIHYYDRELLEEPKEILGMELDEIHRYDDKLKNPFTKALYPMGFSSSLTQTKIFELQKRKIQEIAKKESCVIVGRLAESILKDQKNVLRVFIYAPEKVRIMNCTTELNIYIEDAVRMIKSVDKARKNYHEVYTDTNYASIDDHELLIDSSLLGVNGTVRLLKSIVEEKFLS